MGDFNHGVINVVNHRPWPMPERPWLMTQTWTNLLFAHWPVDAARLRALVPEPFELDVFDGTAWLGVVPFSMSNVSARGVPPLPWLSAFAELNVRTYVRVGHKPGVFFFSLDAERWPAVKAARGLLNLPYYTADMKVRRDGRAVGYTSRRSSDPAVELAARYEPDGPIRRAEPGSLDYFLTERYCLYALRRDGLPYRLEIHHPPWPLQAARAEFTRNTMASRLGIALNSEPLLHFSTRQDIVAWSPDVMEAATPAGRGR